MAFLPCRHLDLRSPHLAALQEPRAVLMFADFAKVVRLKTIAKRMRFKP